MGDPGAGREILTGILAAQPDFVPARVNLAKLDILEGRLTQARAALDALLRYRRVNGKGEAIDAALRAHGSKRAIEAVGRKR